MFNGMYIENEPLKLPSRRGKPVVMISLEDHEAPGKPPALSVSSSPSANSVLESFAEVDEISFLPNTLSDLGRTGKK